MRNIIRKVMHGAREIIKKLLSDNVKDYIRKLIYIQKITRRKGWKAAFDKKRKEGLDTIPIIVLTFNRRECLEKFVSAIKKRFTNPIVIIDNNSTYPPLLEYLSELECEGCKVYRMNDNMGHMTFWIKDEFEAYRKDFYIFSDPDIVLMDECPDDLICRLFNVLENYPNLRKVAPSLNVKDIPETSVFYNDEFITAEERSFNNVRYVKKADAYANPTDTTFALYPPETISVKDHFASLRLAYPYQAIHTPWMKEKDTITEEDRYYFSHRASYTGAYNPIEEIKTD